ncbi:MAG TPA: hypothetical protein VFX15_12195 [Actinomycetes bacterium]|nr:hypothetical protein [Actinomycetes bacterium]
MARGAGQVFLHVGVPKTGTTFLQGVMAASRKTLKEHGVLYPGPNAGHFWAAQDLTEHLFLGRENPKVPGSWAKVVRQARRWPDTTVISHELFTLATPEQVRRAASDLSQRELHVVLTVRDFDRQLPAVWQERLKNGGRVSFATHFTQALEHDAARPAESLGFWRQQDAVGILRRWSEVLPPERIHVITIPQPGAPRDTLWRRFAQVVGFDADLVDLATVKTARNVSLGPPQARLLRRINTRLRDSLPPGVYRSVIKRYLSEADAGMSGSAAYGLTSSQRETTRRWSQELRDAVISGGYDIVGDPDELVPDPPETEATLSFDDVPAADEAKAVVSSAAALVRYAPDARAGRGWQASAVVGRLRGRG